MWFIFDGHFRRPHNSYSSQFSPGEFAEAMRKVVESKQADQARKRQISNENEGGFITLRVRPGNRPGRAIRTHGMYSPRSKAEVDQVRLTQNPRRPVLCGSIFQAEIKFQLKYCVKTYPLGPGMRSVFKAPMCLVCPFRMPKMAISRLVGAETSIYLHLVPLSLFETSMDQEQARWHLSYSIGLLSAGKVDVTLAAFGGEPKDCAAFPIVIASPEDGCAPLRNTQQV